MTRKSSKIPLFIELFTTIASKKTKIVKRDDTRARDLIHNTLILYNGRKGRRAFFWFVRGGGDVMTWSLRSLGGRLNKAQ
jgi:hypothetical protein